MSDAFAVPRTVSSLEECYFYHSIDIPGHGTIAGDWDLRGREREYLGHLDVRGKNVLEIGTASGHLCFWMERQGARMCAYDLSDAYEWDLVPYATTDLTQLMQGRKAHIRMINNSWWFAHERLQSNARVAYGTAYDVSDRIGRFDVVTLSCILLHLRDPFLAIQRAASAAIDTMVITDRVPLPGERAWLDESCGIRFLPNARAGEPLETWWQLSPAFVAETLRVLGFSDVTISEHRQQCRGNSVDLFTIVAHKREPQRRVEGAAGHGGPVAADHRIHEAVLERIPARQLLRHLVKRVLRRVP